MIFQAGVANGSEVGPPSVLNGPTSILIVQTPDQVSGKKARKLLSDHPGSATALTSQQKSEIRAFVREAKGKDSLICTGLSLANQRASMYRVLKLRAELVCEYAKSLEPSLTTTIREKTTEFGNRNGRVTVSSR